MTDPSSAPAMAPAPAETDGALLDADLLQRLAERLAAAPLSDSDAALRIRALSGETGLPAPLVQQVWRELAGEQRRRQGLPPVAVHAGRQPGRIIELARARFGAAARYLLAERPEIALAAARPPQGAAVIALDPDQAWWLRLLAEPALRVTGVLPDLFGHGPRSAFVVRPQAPEPTGSDETYLATDSPGSGGVVIQALGDAGLAAELVMDVGGLKLIAIAGYVQADDPRIDAAPGRLKGVIGAAPVPLDP